MIRSILIVGALALLAGCGDGQPFTFGGGNTPDQTPGGTLGGVELPPGTQDPANTQSISRYEKQDGQGGGYAESISYDSGADTFTVDNLAFDGLNTYQRSGQAGSISPYASLNGYKVFEAEVTVPDFLTGNPVDQIVPYHAIYGESTTTVSVNGVPQPRTKFAIVRTGGYGDYGFGGFVYARNGGVTLPPAAQTGQAIFAGKYAGMRIYNGRSGLEFTQADMQVSIDFGDFNSNDAIDGRIYNRTIVGSDGSAVAVGNQAEDLGQLPLPDLRFVIQAGVDSLNDAGEIAGTLKSVRPANPGYTDGPTDPYESGYYYGVLAGDLNSGAGGELVGVIVIKSDDPRIGQTGVQAQETGGFILVR